MTINEINPQNCCSPFQIKRGMAFLILLLSFSCSVKEEQPLIGVKIYQHTDDYLELITEWKDLGINTVFSSVNLLMNSEFRDLCREHQLKTFVIFPVFFDPDALEQDSSLYAITDSGERAIDDWVKFVCPSRQLFREKKLSEVRRLVKDLQPDGLSIDFIRHFGYWEKIDANTDPCQIPNSCFDDSCMALFQDQTGISLPDAVTGAKHRAQWILENHKDQWVRWKCGVITAMVRDIRMEVQNINPDILINVHIVPWLQQDFNGAIKTVLGQDITDLNAEADYLSPMTYAHMLEHSPSWIHEVVVDNYAQTRGRILPSIQAGKAYLDHPLTDAEFSATILEALKAPSAGLVVWSWEHLSQSPSKKIILKELVLNN